MAIIPSTISSQEKIVGALSYIFFYIPFIMGVKTEFTLFHSRQAFVFNCIFVLAIFVGFFPYIGLFLRWVTFLSLFVFGAWAAYQAYLGNKFTVPYIGENANNIIAKIGISHLFQI
ncbi:MAG: hypothetical protein QG561_589 [Patescibacteria group bacterium]|jgi:uncharacterized membrane protein|nr:hypothetical protein [Patescibacteria group bacterium]